jgi:hypothetical protein
MHPKRFFISLVALVMITSTCVLSDQSAQASYTTGSAQFGSSGQYLSIPGSIDLAPGTGDFTVEWWQYMTAAPGDSAVSNWPRVWWVSGSFGVSIESSPDPTFYLWVGGAWAVGTMTNFSTTYKNRWLHVAVTRSGTSLRVFFNGTQFGSTLTNSTNISDTTSVFAIGNHAGDSARCAFPGLITNFHFVKGTALYTSNFTAPTAPTNSVANTKMLLKFSNNAALLTDSSASTRVVTNIGATTFSATSPPWADINLPTTTTAPTWSGTIVKGQTSQLSATGSVAGKIRFSVDGKRIANCLAVPTAGSAPFTAICNWKATTSGMRMLSASLMPSSATYLGSNSPSQLAWVVRRTTTR